MADLNTDVRYIKGIGEQRAKALGKLIVAHCEDNSLLHGGYIHDGAYARTHGHRGICSESEWGRSGGFGAGAPGRLRLPTSATSLPRKAWP